MHHYSSRKVLNESLLHIGAFQKQIQRTDHLCRKFVSRFSGENSITYLPWKHLLTTWTLFTRFRPRWRMRGKAFGSRSSWKCSVHQQEIFLCAGDCAWVHHSARCPGTGPPCRQHTCISQHWPSGCLCWAAGWVRSWSLLREVLTNVPQIYQWAAGEYRMLLSKLSKAIYVGLAFIASVGLMSNSVCNNRTLRAFAANRVLFCSNTIAKQHSRCDAVWKCRGVDFCDSTAV